MVYNIDSWSRDTTSSCIIAYLIPVLHLEFYICFPLPHIVIICSLLHDFHVLMNSSVSVLNSSPLKLVDHAFGFSTKGCQGVYLRDIFGIWILGFDLVM